MENTTEPTETDAVEETDATEAVESEDEQEGEVLSSLKQRRIPMRNPMTLNSFE